MLAKPSLFSSLIALILAGSALAGCAGNPGPSDPALPLAPLSQMPADVQSAPAVVQQAYQFAAANPDLMKQIPCYCGCGALGHPSNYACYVRDVKADGSLGYDSHALGCSICVDITQDTMRLFKQGQSPPAIRAYIDNTYARYGPSNMP